jgi:hypothetical protein
MTTFFDLFAQNARGPESWTDPTWLDREFLAALRRHGLAYWRPGDAIASSGERLLLGIAPTSGYDMRLLDVIVEGHRQNNGQKLIVEVFNMWECTSDSEYDRRVPSLGVVFQSPVAGHWIDGRWTRSEQGFYARDWIAKLFGSSSDTITGYVTHWREAQMATREG